MGDVRARARARSRSPARRPYTCDCTLISFCGNIADSGTANTLFRFTVERRYSKGDVLREREMIPPGRSRVPGGSANERTRVTPDCPPGNAGNWQADVKSVNI